MNLIKRLAIPALLAVSFSSQADSDIDNKVNCAANAIVLNLMFEDKNNTEIPTQKERVGVWSNAINKKLIELGNSPAEAKNILKDAIRKSKDARTSIYKDKSKALKRLHTATKDVESRYTPTAFLKDILDIEWDHAENNGGMTFMGETVKGLTRALTSIQNTVLYGSKADKN
jgi:hypothetical protein